MQDSLDTDKKFMEQALHLAKKAYASLEVPVGAVIVYKGEIIATAYNQVESLQQASAHAEMLCLQKASAVLQNWRLLECTLYVTLEPCAMCSGALLLSRVKRVVWAAPDKRLGGDGSWMDILSFPHPMHTIEITRNFLAQESRDLMQKFFKERRKEKKGISSNQEDQEE